MFHPARADLTNIEKPQEIAEVATTIRSIGDIRSLSTDTAQRSLSVRGTADQVALAESLAHELIIGRGSNAYEYRMSTGDLVHVYYLPRSESIREFQNYSTTIRSITEIRYLFTYNSPRAIVVRGSPEQLEMAEWLARQFDQPGDAQTGTSEYRVKGAADDLVHVYFVKHVESAENLQELATFVRSVGNIRRLFITSGKPMTVAVRGTAEETGLADWLLQKFDQSTSDSSGADQDQGGATRLLSSGDAVKVFYLRNATIQAFQNLASEVRAAGGPKVFTYNAFGALAVRGTTDQLASAPNLIKERFKNSQ